MQLWLLEWNAAVTNNCFLLEHHQVHFKRRLLKILNFKIHFFTSVIIASSHLLCVHEKKNEENAPQKRSLFIIILFVLRTRKSYSCEKDQGPPESSAPHTSGDTPLITRLNQVTGCVPYGYWLNCSGAEWIRLASCVLLESVLCQKGQQCFKEVVNWNQPNETTLFLEENFVGPCFAFGIIHIRAGIQAFWPELCCWSVCAAKAAIHAF